MSSGQLMNAVADLSRTATKDFTVDELLQELCEVAARDLAVDAAGVMSVEGSRVRFVHARPAAAVHVERLQEVLQAGPCAMSIASGETVVVSDLADDLRWPEYVVAARDGKWGAVVATPLVSRGRTWGSLELYQQRPTQWSAEEIDAARLLADVAVSYIVMATDRDIARAAQADLSHRSMHDQLTGLPNRVLLFDRLEHALARSRRHDSAVAVVFIDLNEFKRINDKFGHGVGDIVLTEVAQRMLGTLRDGDTLSRLAGDEFVLLCEDLPGPRGPELGETMAIITDRIRAVLAEPIRVAHLDLEVTASIGMAVATDDSKPTDLLHDADTAMYRAKEDTRGRVVINDHLIGASRHEGQLKRDVVHALDRGQLRVHYQPIVDAADRRVVAVEALLRWEHPDHGLLAAADFIRQAESTGAIISIGRWVLDLACGQLRTWQKTLDDRAPDTVFCNLSPPELTDGGIDAAIASALSAHELRPTHLGLEIVEDDLTNAFLEPILGRYQQQGHPLAVDDFGTGYSSLSRLVHLPVSCVKIDRAFAAGLPDDARSRALVDAVLVVAANLNVHVIGAGVENNDQARQLTSAGCHLLQGFHIGEPMPADDISALLAAQALGG